MIKQLTAFLMTAIILSVVLPFSAFAAESTAEAVPTVRIGDVEVSYRAKEVEVPLIFENTDSYAGFFMSMKYDSALCVESAKLVDPDDSFFLAWSHASGILEDNIREATISCFGSESVTGSSTVMLFTFSLPENAEAGTVYSINISYMIDNSFDTFDKVYLIETVPGSITLTDSVLYGDVNSDGKVTLKDAASILRRIMGDDVDLDVLCADVNLDGALNAKDAALILRHIVGWQNARLGHRDISETLVVATCQNEGKVRLTCAECGDTAEVVTQKVDHRYILGKCTMCGGKTYDYPFLVYCDYLEKNAPYDENLRGYSFYTTMQYDGFRVFVSNIYDDSTDSLCLFGTAYFDNGLTAAVSIDIPDVEKVLGEYDCYYECYYENEVIASIECAGRTVSPNNFHLKIDKYVGDDASEESHKNIGETIADLCLLYMKDILAESGLDITLQDFKINYE